MSFLDNCRRLIGLDSSPGHGNLAAAEFVGELCRGAGLFVEYQRESLDGIEQCNVIARPVAETPSEEFMLQTHLDTVDPGHFGHWTKTQSNPYNASIYGDEIFGLGTADVKLDFLCKLEAAREFIGRPVKTPFVLVGTFGAQSGMAGAIKLIRRKKTTARRALIGAPTGLRLVHAGKGLAVIEISIPFSNEEHVYRREHDHLESASSQSRMFSGRAAHSSDPKGGDNAIMKMLEYLSQLPEGIAVLDLDGGIGYNTIPAKAVLEIDTVAGFKDPILPKISRLYSSLRALEQELLNFREDGFSPAHPTINMGTIRTFENEVRITGSVRLPPSVTDVIYEGWMRGLESAVGDVGATFRVKDYRKGFSTLPEAEFVTEAGRLLSGLGYEGMPVKSTSASEASVFSRHGIDCLLFGPGMSVGNSHAPNECVKISELRAATDFYRKALERFST